MTDEVEALIARLNDAIHMEQMAWRGHLLMEARDALEAATVAPAVDREELVNLISSETGRGRDLALDVVDMAVASGIIRDVRDVQAEALERVREEIRALACWADPVTGRSGFNLGNDEDGEAGARMAVLDILAQAIREARSER